MFNKYKGTVNDKQSQGPSGWSLEQVLQPLNTILVVLVGLGVVQDQNKTHT